MKTALALLAMTPLLLSSCDRADPDITSLVVEARINVCLDSGAVCYALPLPEAAVEAVDAGGEVITSEQLDDVGRATFRLPSADLPSRVIVRSPLISGGSMGANVVASAGDETSITLTGQLVAGATGA